MDFMLVEVESQVALYLRRRICRSAINGTRIGYNPLREAGFTPDKSAFSRPSFSKRPRRFTRTHMADANDFVIQGLTLEGKPFRPSDWADRLAGVMCSFGGGNRMAYSPYCYPISTGGIKCVVVDARLKEIEPMAYNFLLNFARDNELQLHYGGPEAAQAEAKK
jgi:hypothetical protein